MNKTDPVRSCKTCRWYKIDEGYYNFAHQWVAPCVWDRATAHISDALKQGTVPYINRDSGKNCMTWEPKDAKTARS